MTNALANSASRSDFFKDVAQLGRDTAEGKDAKPRLALRTVIAARDGAITLEVTKDANGKPQPDDAYAVYDKYLDAEAKKARFEHTKDGIKKGASEIRTFIKLGLSTAIDPVRLMDKAEAIHAELDQKARKSAFPALLAVARAQLEDGQSDTMLSDDQIRAACSKDGVEPKSQAAYLKSALKALEKSLEADDADSALAEKINLLIDGAGAVLQMIERSEQRLALLAQLQALDTAA